MSILLKPSHFASKSPFGDSPLNDKRYVESDEISDGVIFDYDRQGKTIGIEILDASHKFPKDFSHDFIKSKILVSAV